MPFGVTHEIINIIPIICGLWPPNWKPILLSRLTPPPDTEGTIKCPVANYQTSTFFVVGHLRSSPLLSSPQETKQGNYGNLLWKFILVHPHWDLLYCNLCRIFHVARHDDVIKSSRHKIIQGNLLWDEDTLPRGANRHVIIAMETWINSGEESRPTNWVQMAARDRQIRFNAVFTANTRSRFFFMAKGRHSAQQMGWAWVGGIYFPPFSERPSWGWRTNERTTLFYILATLFSQLCREIFIIMCCRLCSHQTTTPFPVLSCHCPLRTWEQIDD